MVLLNQVDQVEVELVGVLLAAGGELDVALANLTCDIYTYKHENRDVTHRQFGEPNRIELLKLKFEPVREPFELFLKYQKWKLKKTLEK